MAADQLNKRSKGSNVIRHTSWEMQKAKKKKFSHYDLNTKSNISLEWDDKKEHVVPKKEQISIARRELTPFLPFDANDQNVLGDVFAAPSELFELNNLTGLLPYEVWQTHLSAQEREFLTQFLPEGADSNRNVHELLSGNNFYFGNPLSKWGASLCSGDCHPDAVLRQEQCNKANKIAYYSELNEYHTKMIGSLQVWKEKWASCANPENDFMQTITRSKKEFHKSGSSPEDDIGATSNSGSWDADDKSYSSDIPDLAITNGEISKKDSRMDLGSKSYDSSGGISVAKSRKGDKLRRVNIECGDGAKYMSYIKVSKEQHERVKSSMKHSNTSIQPRSLNHVLGNLDSFSVQPYEVFEEEERQNLHEHWLHLAKTDLPAGFENWKSLQSAKCRLTKSLKKEIEDKWKSNNQPVSNLYNQNDENSGFICLEQNGDSAFGSEPNLNTENHDNIMQIEHPDESSQDSAQNQHLTQISIQNNSQSFIPLTMDADNNVLTASAAFPSNLVDYTENISHVDASVGEQFLPPPSTASDIWPPATLPPPPLPSVYYQQPTPVTHGYPANFLNRRSDGGDSFFYPYANQDRNELLLHSLFKDPGNSHYLQEQKLSRLGFHPTVSDPMAGPGQISRNLIPSLPLHHNIQENEFQEHLLPLNHIPDWPVNAPMAAPTHHRLSQNWFSGEEVAVRDGWSGGVVPNHDVGNIGQVGQVTDESLFSVLSQCNGLRSGGHYGSTEFVQSGNYVGVGRAVVPPMTTTVVPPRGSPGFNYVGGNESQSVGRWMSLPRSLQENGGKSFPRLWNEKDLG